MISPFRLFLIVLLLLSPLPILAQTTGSPVQIIGYPRSEPTTVLDYSGTNMIYAGYAVPNQPSCSWTRSSTTSNCSATRFPQPGAATLTSIVVSTNTGTATTSAAHGLLPGNLVTISGATVDAQLNGTYYIQTVGATTTFTITTASVSDATYNESTLVVSTASPRTTTPVWAIQKLSYDGSNNLIRKQWANGNSGAFTSIWDNRAVTTGTTKITYK